MQPQLNGIILVDKAVDTNSFNVIAGMRRLCGMKRIGHCGTLDPFASGLLPVAIGRATGIVQFLTDLDKEYTVEITFGERRNTLDRDGEVIARGSVEFDSADEFARRLKTAAASLIGRQKQIPPMFSAVKVAGKPLYYYARKGEEIERKAREITVFDATVLKCDLHGGDLPTATVRIHCSKGTYIRTWVDALGEKLGTYAYASELRRSGVGPFREQTSWHRMDDLFDVFNGFNREVEAMRAYLAEHVMINAAEALPDWPRLELSKRKARDLLHGRRLELNAADLIDAFGANDKSTRLLLVHRDLLCAVTKPFSEILRRVHIEDPEGAGNVPVPTERILFGEDDFKALEDNK